MRGAVAGYGLALVAGAVLLLGAARSASDPTRRGDAAAPSPYLFVLAGDSAGDSPDFLAVLDADPASERYGAVLSTTPLGTTHGMPHHSEFDMPSGGRGLFANAFMAGRSFVMDLSDPAAPRVAAEVDSVPGYRQPHSFWRMPDGRVLATLQFGAGNSPGDPGGLAMFSPEGRLLQVSSAAESSMPGARIRVYAIDGSAATDRVLTTSSPMNDEQTAHVVQLWRLSDMALLHTIPMPESATDSSWQYPFEIRFLPGGRTAMLNTWNCGFYYLSDLDGEPRIERTMSLPLPANTGCGVPLVIGNYWIMPVWYGRVFHVIDVADPRRPNIVSTLAVDSTFAPHWASRDPASDRVVFTSGEGDLRVTVAHFDSATGTLRIDERFRDAGSDRPGVSFSRLEWPHGASGPAEPHAAVFGSGSR